MTFKKYCYREGPLNSRVCSVELDIDSNEVYEELERRIKEDDLKHIPEEIDITIYRDLDPEGMEVEEAEFEIRVRDYLDDNDIEELEKLIGVQRWKLI